MNMLHYLLKPRLLNLYSNNEDLSHEVRSVELYNGVYKIDEKISISLDQASLVLHLHMIHDLL